MSLLKRCGIPGPEPNLILGNVIQMSNTSVLDYQKHLIETYGRVVGYYTGAHPTVLVSEIELVRLILSSDFKNFINRPEMDIALIFPEKEHDGAIMRATGQKWKNTRNLMTSSFSPSKLKAIKPQIEDSITTFLDIIGKNAETGVEFDFYPLAEGLTAEVMIKTSFGIENNIQMDTNFPFFQDARLFMKVQPNKLLYLLVSCLPWTFPMINRFRRLDIFNSNSCTARLFRAISFLIRQRKDSPSHRRDDMLQTLIDTELDINEDKPEKKENLIRLSEDEIKANALMFYVAGFDTTTFGLAVTVHHLVNYPEVQEKVRREVQELYDSAGSIDYKSVSAGLQYMDCVIKESLRLYTPIVNLISRQCLQDYKYKDLVIPKGATVMIPPYPVHYDPEYWPNPKVFDPERFSAERKNELIPHSFLAFGEGPRNCIGMRFAYMEMKAVLAKLLLQYRLERATTTEIGTLSTTLKTVALMPKYGVNVIAVKI